MENVGCTKLTNKKTFGKELYPLISIARLAHIYSYVKVIKVSRHKRYYTYRNLYGRKKGTEFTISNSILGLLLMSSKRIFDNDIITSRVTLIQNTAAGRPKQIRTARLDYPVWTYFAS